MGTVDLPKSGKNVRPQTRSVYLPDAGENRRDSLERIFREQSGRFSSRLGARLSAEALPRLDLDEKIYDFISRNYNIISGSFPVLNDDLSHEYAGNAAVKKTAVKITSIMESSGGADLFNTGEIEKKLVKRQWGIDDLEVYTDNMLRKKTGIGSVFDSQKANSVVVCVFKDNAKKPKTVTELRLAVNIPETELIGREFLFRAGAAYLVRDIICKHLSENAADNEEAGSLLDSLQNDLLELNSAELDEHLKNMDKGEEIEEIRSRGFSAAADLIVSILDSVKLDCQFLENMKEKRELLIREYEDTDEANLPDEHYQIRMGYFSKTRLLEERGVYDDMLKSLYAETRRLWDLLEVIYQDSKSVFKVNDYEDLVRKNRNRLNKPVKNGAGGNDASKEEERADKEKIRVLLAKMEERLRNISDSMYPVERKITEERLSMLEKEFSRFENRINPYNLQPGILVDIDLMSIKRKRITLDSMSAALGRFLDHVSDCFSGATQAALPK
jgi:hypothetical protein